MARDHRYRIPVLPDDFSGMSVLDVGTFDGFYAFLAEARGAERVVAVDNEQYRDWVLARWGVELEGGEGFRTIAELLGSQVEYRRLDAFELDLLDEQFDLVFCFGILHRVEGPLGLLGVLRRRLAGRRLRAAGDLRGRQPRAGARGRDACLGGGRGLRSRRLRVLGFHAARAWLVSPTTPGSARWRSSIRR